MNNDCSKTKTEKQLFIHKNTLIARLNTINKILNCDVNRAEDLFNVQLAMKIYLALQLGHFDKSAI
ncbi:helix-turn-helix domain-containing protein [Klebsiella spallanzanii]|uniref:helix-turn-helix domain-containing protein n=1 Tax=Klebsiella spallanzanii TaxID=2587528 RepID=UPI0039EAB325